MSRTPSLDRVGDSLYRLNGQLCFAETTRLFKVGLALFRQRECELEIDLQGVVHSDSSGLILLLAWRRQAIISKSRLKLSNPSQQLINLAMLYNLEEILQFS